MRRILKFSIPLFVLFLLANQQSNAQGIRYTPKDTVKYIFKNEIGRFFSGTFWSGVEIPLKNKKSIYFSGIVTYGSPYNSSKELIGYGGEFQYRSYLGKGTFVTDRPLYLATQLMFRRITEYTLNSSPLFNDDPYPQIIGYSSSESKKGYNVYYGGVLLGCQMFVNQLFTVDFNVGGGIRLTQIDGQKSFSRFKSLTSLDYSGVVPRVGFVIGIIQH